MARRLQKNEPDDYSFNAEKSWVLSASMVIIPILLIVLAVWLWPVMRQIYSLPDSAVLTYQHALNNMVPPGVGRITRTAVIEKVLAGELGELSNLAERTDSTNAAQLLEVLEFNSRMGRWAAAVMTLPQSQRVAMFNWGMRPKNLPVVNQAFSRWSADHNAAVNPLASALLTRWKASAIANSATARGPLTATTMPALQLNLTLQRDIGRAVVLGEAKAAKAELRSNMKAVSSAISGLAQHRVSAPDVNAALACEYRTLIGVAALMRWQPELEKIMRFNAAMSRWMYLVAQLEPVESRAMFNWVRFRTQNVELMRLAMSRQRSQRVRTVSIAPKLHGVERAWLIHRLLMDQRVSVELSVLHELWKMPTSPRLKKMLNHWTHMEPLPNGHGPHTIEFNGQKYVVDRMAGVKRYRQARQMGAMVLARWQKGKVNAP